VPTYQYACTDCAERLEVVQRFTDEPLSVCSSCGGRLRKVFSPVGIVFKGSGFYRTDSRKSQNGADTSRAAANGSSGSKSESTSESGGSGGSGGSGSGDSGSSSGEKKAGQAAGAGSSSSGSASGSSSSSGSSGSGSGSKVA
jgi:putative FmdB family regulatory protein